MPCNAFRENKILAKISEFTVNRKQQEYIPEQILSWGHF